MDRGRFFCLCGNDLIFLTGSTAAAADEPIQEIVITATKTKNDRKLIPQSVDVLTQKDLPNGEPRPWKMS